MARALATSSIASTRMPARLVGASPSTTSKRPDTASMPASVANVLVCERKATNVTTAALTMTGHGESDVTTATVTSVMAMSAAAWP